MPTIETGLVALALSFVAAVLIPSVAIYLLLAFYTERKLEEHRTIEEAQLEELAQRLDAMNEWDELGKRLEATEGRGTASAMEVAEPEGTLDSHTAKFAGVLTKDPPENPRTVVRDDETIYIAPPCSYIAFRGESAIEPETVVFGFQERPGKEGSHVWMRAFRTAIEEGRVECRGVTTSDDPGTDPPGSSWHEGAGLGKPPEGDG